MEATFGEKEDVGKFLKSRNKRKSKVSMRNGSDAGLPKKVTRNV